MVTGRQGRQPNASYRSVEGIRSRWSLDFVQILTIVHMSSTGELPAFGHAE